MTLMKHMNAKKQEARLGRWTEGSSWRLTRAVLPILIACIPVVGLAEDGGGQSLEESSTSPLAQVSDLRGTSDNLNGQGLANLLQTDGDLNDTVDLNQTQAPANAGELTAEQIKQGLDNRSSSSSSNAERRQSTHSRGW